MVSKNAWNMAKLMDESEKMSKMLFGETKPYVPDPFFLGQITHVEAGVVETIATNLALNLLVAGFVGMAIKLKTLVMHFAEDAVPDTGAETADATFLQHIEISAVQPTAGTLLGLNDPRVFFRDQSGYQIKNSSDVGFETTRITGRYSWGIPNALVVTNNLYIHLEGAIFQTNVIDYRFFYDLKPIQFMGLGQQLTAQGILFGGV